MRRLTGLLLFCIPVVPAAAVAFSISLTPYNNVVRWDHANLTYYLDPNGAPGISDGSDIAAMHASFDGWEAVSCSALTFQYLGNTSNKSVIPITGQTNGKNELVFITNSAWTFGQYTLGVTSPLYYYDGKIVEADIAFNGYLQSWSTTGDYWKVDVKSVVIHEIGHFFGLQHVLYGYDPNDPPTMAPAADPYGKTATLEDDDKMGACFLYPANGYYTCTTDAQCPYVVDTYSNGDEYYSKKLKCQNGYCSGIAGVSPGSVDFGGTCNQPSDCKSPNACKTLDSGVQVCTQPCDPYADKCPTGYHCAKVGVTNEYLCTPGSKKKTEGEPCSSSYECATSFCFSAPDGSGMTCRVACNKTSPSCLAGQACWAPSYSTTGACFPEDQVPVQKKSLGSVCKNDAECQSGLCFGAAGEQSLCRKACTVEAQDCYSGYYCADVGGRGACLPGTPPPKKKPDGDACTAHEDCESNWCVPLIGTNQSYCRHACNLSDWLCPWGTACVSYGSTEFGVCMPDLNKSHTGEACSNNQECVTGICWTGAGGASYCTQNCIGGWCPEGMICADGGYFGGICTLPENVQPTGKPDGTACSANGDCANGWCVPLIGTSEAYCRTACKLADGLCPWGTACVSYGSSDFGVCMPDVGKARTGETCTGGPDCVTGICWPARDGGSYCTQNCIAGWCPDGFECADGGGYGSVCVVPGSPVPPPEDAQEPPFDPGVPPSQDSGTPAPAASGQGGGCSAAGSFAPAPAGWLAVAFSVGWMLIRRGRRAR